MLSERLNQVMMKDIVEYCGFFNYPIPNNLEQMDRNTLRGILSPLLAEYQEFWGDE